MRPSILRHALVPLAGCLVAALPGHAQPADATALSGRWTGTYDCNQGVTALELSLRGNAHGIVHGTFEFSAAPENPDVPSGTYPVMGRFTGTSLVLRPIDVTGMPGTYVPVGIQATVTGRRMTGWIEGPGCGAIEVQRADAARPGDPLPGGYGGQRWAAIADGDLGRLYLDAREPYGTESSVMRVWMRWETLQDMPDSGLVAGQVMEWELEVDCAAELVRIWHTLDYAPDGELQSFDGFAPYGWEPLTEGSMNAIVFDRACSDARLPAERG
jgi:hypothetical protein